MPPMQEETDKASYQFVENEVLNLRIIRWDTNADIQGSTLNPTFAQLGSKIIALDKKFSNTFLIANLKMKSASKYVSEHYTMARQKDQYAQ